jgi:hypothetical protein
MPSGILATGLQILAKGWSSFDPFDRPFVVKVRCGLSLDTKRLGLT